MAQEIIKFKHKITFGTGSSSGHPDFKGMQTCDIQMWMKLDDFPWFRPYGSFRQMQIEKMIDICKNEYQLIDLMELLSAKKEDRVEQK